jgi:hypothetical protein
LYSNLKTFTLHSTKGRHCPFILGFHSCATSILFREKAQDVMAGFEAFLGKSPAASVLFDKCTRWACIMWNLGGGSFPREIISSNITQNKG